MSKVSGIVVIFNPDAEVLENIATYSDQLDYLYVFDNSELPNEYSRKISDMKGVHYSGMKENRGMAFALNYGIEKSTEDHSDFLLTMDQDSKATPEMVSKLMQAMDYNEEVVITSPVHSNKFNTQVPGEGKYSDVVYAKTSGNLVNLRKIEKLGGFRDGYFIDYVDIEYGFRIKKNNLKIIQVNDAILIHREADITKRKLLWITAYPMNHAPVRLYYKARNLLYLRDEYNKLYPDLVRHEVNYFIKLVIKILLFEKYKTVKFKMMVKGFIDYRHGISGRLN